MNILSLRHRPPQSLGEGMQRVVRAAGKGIKGEQVKNSMIPAKYIEGSQNPDKLFAINSGDIREKTFSNGVRILYGDINAGRKCKEGYGFFLAGDRNLLGIFSPFGKLFAAKASSSCKNTITQKLDHYEQRYVSNKSNKVSQEDFARDTEELFKIVKG